MKVKSDGAIFEAVIAEAAKKAEEDIDRDFEPDPFTETEEYMAMMDRVYKAVNADMHKEQKKKNNKRKIFVIAAIVAATFICTFNVSAFRLFFYKTYLDVRGDILNIKTDTQGMAEQYASINYFECKDEIMIPGWLPKGTELVNIDDTKNTLIFTYKYDDNIISLIEKNIVNAERQNSIDIYLEDSSYKVDNLTVNGCDVSIVYLKGTTGKKSYTAIWNNDKIVYTLKAEIEENLLYAILYSLKFRR